MMRWLRPRRPPEDWIPTADVGTAVRQYARLYRRHLQVRRWERQISALGTWPLRVRAGRIWLALGAWPEMRRASIGRNNYYVRCTTERWKAHAFGFKFVWDWRGCLLTRGASFSLEYRKASRG